MAPVPGPTMRAASSSSTSAAASRTGEDEELRPYVIVSDIGLKGSFATVYKGYHKDDTRNPVAIMTVLRSKLSPKLLANLQSEIHILKSLAHRHVTTLIDFVPTDRNIYFITEYCAGGDLATYIKKRGRVESLAYVPSAGAASAPQYYPHPPTGGLDELVVRSFLRNFIHRDVKPQNLLLNAAPPSELARGHPLGVPILKLADFALFARAFPTPEPSADLWSVGAVLYELAVGTPPFRAADRIALLEEIERLEVRGIGFPDEDEESGFRDEDLKPKPKPKPKSHSSALKSGGVPPDVKELIRALLKPNPVERASFAEFFGSAALANSKFPRPESVQSSDANVAVEIIPARL
ncbi:kinase-like domain-containing protein [Mycena galericulata]|nr:kinase-like domain-containing protein [Mycena galericulata]